ncbi:HlyD family secretion protein [Novosphingobium sp.]|uniref:HlyD family secretion protein n=1 Tax=Novosphingobium sp. TaxID=1874826 RepID=UPI0022C9BF7C|nr:HlyD family secretion protein [Novosphingobium sp.]MCZ8018358.1 HlyD family secretion protein [Novosphingobium sp.]MCZ8033352.1 HlyD family secretion protein [Novosphingobium sp.]MCZ8051807.1 HlyD family secretion protein [Novosphingobium sp.]MCZ8060349.1 HlyD family secretion protein [Novosphingobium sp.]MCZ8231991.1 HlyD family secretion protein [Novosphingobium sp.]
MAEADPTMPTAAQVASEPHKRNWQRLILMGAVPLLVLLGGLVYWYSLQGKASTDNAYVKLDKVSVSSEIGGKIVAVAVREDQQVKPGDLLFRIDPEPYALQLRQADASIAAAQANVSALANASALSGADLTAARENIAFARTNLSRQQALWERGFTTKAALDAAKHQVASAEAQLDQAVAKQREAGAKLATGAQVPGINPQIAAATAQRALAELQLRRTEVRAPIGGTIAQADRLLVGQEAIAGLPVLTIVARQGSYVEANFKETDLADMRVGQRAEVRFDAYPGVRLKGHVAAIGAGTGSEFSVLPAQNATGNWVKVTQRVPVRIVLDEPSPRELIAGLSSKVTVYTAEQR